MAEFPALPLFTDAIVADCHHLTDEEFGRYMRILILMWRSPNCRIPADPQWIAKRIKVDALAYAQHIQPIMQEFCTQDAGWWTQKRLLKEYQYVQGLTEKRRKAANERWHKSEVPENKGKPSMQTDMQKPSTAYAPTPTPTPTPNKKDRPTFSGDDFSEFFKVYPKATAQGLARASFSNAILMRGADPQRIINAAKNFAAKAAKLPEEERKFIPNPSKWLDSECYDDPDLQEQAKAAPSLEDFTGWQRTAAAKFGVHIAKSWFQQCTLDGETDTLYAPSRFVRDHIKQNYASDLRDILNITNIELKA